MHIILRVEYVTTVSENQTIGVFICGTRSTLKRVTCNPFRWNKAGDFRTPILCPSMDKSKIEAAPAGNALATLHPNEEKFKLKKTLALNQSLKLQGHELVVERSG